MNDLHRTISEALIQLKAIKATITDDYSLKAADEKYGILFLDSITTIDVKNFLEKVHHIDVDIDTINSQIPDICEQLNIKYSPLQELSQIGNNQICAYSLTL